MLRIEDGDRPYAATNSLILLSRVGTESAIEILVENASSRDQSEWWLRLVAAKNVADFMASNRKQDLRTDFLSARITELSNAAAAERHPNVLRYQLEALMKADSSRFARNSRIQVFGRIATGLGAAARNGAKDHRLLAAQHAHCHLPAARRPRGRLRHRRLSAPGNGEAS